MMIIQGDNAVWRKLLSVVLYLSQAVKSSQGGEVLAKILAAQNVECVFGIALTTPSAFNILWLQLCRDEHARATVFLSTTW